MDASIARTYAARSTATLKNSLYDSYIRAIRWGSDRLMGSPQGGIVALVTNGGYVDSNTADGIRLSIVREFHHIYVFNLRGNQRTAGEVSRREGGKIFDAGSRATVAITLLVKQPGVVPDAGATLHYRDIGDYLTRDEKLRILAGELDGQDSRPRLGALGWTLITPNEHGDWINQRTGSFSSHMALAASDEPSAFGLTTHGLKTNRDAWNWNSSRGVLDANVTRMVEHYNAQVESFAATHGDVPGTLAQRAELAKATVDLDPSRFSWDHADFNRLVQGQRYGDQDRLVHAGHYRPFHRRWVEAGSRLNNRTYQLPRVFPEATSDNLAIGVLDVGSPAPFSVLCTSVLPDDKLVGAGNAMQFLPRYIYGPRAGRGKGQAGLFDDASTDGRRHNVTDHALDAYRALDPAVDRDDIFFYVYGILHSTDYRAAFASDLKRSLPRIPQVATADDFWAFSRAGRELARLHTEYETVESWSGLTVRYVSGFDALDPRAHSVLKMKHPTVVDPAIGSRVEDRTRIVYNDRITVEDIPLRAYGYELGSRSAIDWVMEAWRVRTDKASGIVNDPNDWATEHGDPTYILDLLGRVVTVSMTTLDIVDRLPALDLGGTAWRGRDRVDSR